MNFFRFAQGVVGALWREKTMRPKDVAGWQAARATALLQHAATRVPFYQARFGGEVPSIKQWKDLAPVTKAELMDRFEYTITGGGVRLADVAGFARDKDTVGQPLPNGMILSVTSGTTGKVGYFLSDRPAFERARGTLFARLLRDKLTNPMEVLRFGPWNRYRIGFVTAMGGHFVTYQLGLYSPWIGSLLWKPQAFSILTPMPQLCDQLMKYKPHLLHGYPTFMEALAHEALSGRLKVHPDVISLGSEPFTAMARAALQAAFPKTFIAESYGTTECVAIASQCTHGRMHINEDIVVLESVDAMGKPMPEGHLGVKTLLTNLLNYAQPLIRYEIGDQIMIQRVDCPCGSPFRTVKVLGRTDDTFYLKGEDGLFHAHTPIPFEALFLAVEGLTQYQLVHEQQNQLRVVYTRDPKMDADILRGRLITAFAGYLSQNKLAGTVTVTQQEVDEIPRDPNSKKLRQIVSRVSPPTNAEELSGPWRLKGLPSPSDG